MKPDLRPCFPAVLILATALHLSAQPAAQPLPGQRVYEQHCAACHGANGDGNGPASVWLYPRPRDFSAGLNGAQMRLARERYRLLWDITIDGRLAAAGRTPMQPREQHAAAFARGYSFWPNDRQTETFESLWHDAAPNHANFLALIADPRGLRNAHRPAPGASCPLCDFPTFTWADSEALRPEIAARVTAEFPAWSPEQGLCGRCLETYQAAAWLGESPVLAATT